MKLLLEQVDQQWGWFKGGLEMVIGLSRNRLWVDLGGLRLGPTLSLGPTQIYVSKRVGIDLNRLSGEQGMAE